MVNTGGQPDKLMLQPLDLPPKVRQRLGHAGLDGVIHFSGVGRADLLERPLLALLASFDCSEQMVSQAIDLTPGWIEAGKVVISGFHSRLEKQVMNSFLRRRSPVVKVLDRGLSCYRPRPNEAEALAQGRMLIITAFTAKSATPSRESRRRRNLQVLALAAERYLP
jgi:predicted Rossmann fold nucleotide-binding protein DprA/Smf involved in DNA uptake